MVYGSVSPFSGQDLDEIGWTRPPLAGTFPCLVWWRFPLFFFARNALGSTTRKQEREKGALAKRRKDAVHFWSDLPFPPLRSVGWEIRQYN